MIQPSSQRGEPSRGFPEDRKVTAIGGLLGDLRDCEKTGALVAAVGYGARAAALLALRPQIPDTLCLARLLGGTSGGEDGLLVVRKVSEERTIGSLEIAAFVSAFSDDDDRLEALRAMLPHASAPVDDAAVLACFENYGGHIRARQDATALLAEAGKSAGR